MELGTIPTPLVRRKNIALIFLDFANDQSFPPDESYTHFSEPKKKPTDQQDGKKEKPPVFSFRREGRQRGPR